MTNRLDIGLGEGVGEGATACHGHGGKQLAVDQDLEIAVWLSGARQRGITNLSGDHAIHAANRHHGAGDWNRDRGGHGVDREAGRGAHAHVPVVVLLTGRELKGTTLTKPSEISGREDVTELA